MNLLREGLDLPEVSLVAIMDADKEGFLRSEKALIQTSGRAARNINGLVIMYADRIKKSMKKTIDETNRKRIKQEDYNKKNNIIPTQILSKNNNALMEKLNPYKAKNQKSKEININDLNQSQIKALITKTKSKINKKVKELDFIEAKNLRDFLFKLEGKINA